MNQGAFLMRGLENVRGEFSLTALAYNLRRVLNLVGFKDLLAAVAVCGPSAAHVFEGPGRARCFGLTNFEPLRHSLCNRP